MAKKKTTKRAAAKTTKISKLSQAHGKKEKFKATTLDQIWGDDGTSKYRTIDEVEYKEWLDDYARADLQAHAVKMGLIPIDNAEQLKKRLLTEFKKHVSAYKIPETNNTSNKPLSKEAMKILGEGK